MSRRQNILLRISFIRLCRDPLHKFTHATPPPPHPDPLPRPRHHPRNRSGPCPIAALSASSLFPLPTKPAAVRPSVARKPRNRLVLRPQDAAIIRHSVRNTSVRTATRSQTCCLLFLFSFSPLCPGPSPRTWVCYVSDLLPQPEISADKKNPAPASAMKAETGRRARFSYDDLLELFNCLTTLALASRANPATRLPPTLYGSIATPGSSKPVPRWRKNPSSYPDFRTRPFCTTTLIRPLNPSDFTSCCSEAESTSAALTFLRNSTKFFSSLQLSTLLIGNNSWERDWVIEYCDRIAANFESQGRYTKAAVEIFCPLARCYSPRAILPL